MTTLNFTDFFQTDWLTAGTPCTSRLISIPTGLGKTACRNPFLIITQPTLLTP